MKRDGRCDIISPAPFSPCDAVSKNQHAQKKEKKKKKRFELSYERHLTVGGQLIKALWEPRSERRQIWLTVYCSLQLNRHLLHSKIIIVLSNIKTFSLNFTTMWLAIIRWALSHCFATANNNHARGKYLLPTLTRLPFLHPDSVWSSRISLTSLWSAFPLSLHYILFLSRASSMEKGRKER